MRVGEVQLLLSEKFMDLNAVCQKLLSIRRMKWASCARRSWTRKACEIAGYTKERDHGRER